MKLSIVIVNYNVTKVLTQCLNSIEAFVKDLDYEVIVIDNQSTDSSWRKLIVDFPSVKFIENSQNEGFSKANNKAVNHAKGEYILLLNPDTELQQQGLQEVLTFADSQKNLGCLGVRLYDLEGNFLPEAKRTIPNLYNTFNKLFLPPKKQKAPTKDYYRNDLSDTAIEEVEVITGAFLLMKKNLYQKIGGLDEAYFMYGEDIDLCYTLIQMGYRNWYYGAYGILHLKGESTVKDLKYLKNFYGAMQIFIEKYYKKQSPFQYRILQFGLKIRYSIARLQLK